MNDTTPNFNGMDTTPNMPNKDTIQSQVDEIDEHLDDYITILIENRDDPDVLYSNLKSWHKIITQALSQAEQRGAERARERCMDIIENYEIRTDGGGTFENDDTLLLRKELVEELQSLKAKE